MSQLLLSGPMPAPAARRRGPGRHRIDRPLGVRCTDMPAVRARLIASRPDAPHRRPFFRAMWPTVSAGRHTWNFLHSAGGRPRTAFAIILAL